jgi:hypothetical protein
MLALAPAGQAQQAEQEPPRVIPGLRLNSLSAYFGADSMWSRSAATGAGLPSVWLATGGAAADASWLIPGRRYDAEFRYMGSYARNHRFSALNGFDHEVSMVFRANTDRRTSFSLEASGESRLISSALFESTATLSAAQAGAPMDQLAADLMDAGGLAGAAGSAIDLAVSGGRLTTGSMFAGFTHSHSPRLTLTGRVGATRILRPSSNDPRFASMYPSMTMGIANAALSYSLSRRLQLSASGTVTRSFSRAIPFRWETATANLQRLIGRRSFARIEGGYARVDGLGGSGRNSYTAGAGVGTVKGYHTVATALRRGISDMNGAAADMSVAGEATWAWNRPAVPWALAASAAYERVSGSVIGRIRAWVYHATATRRLSPNFHIAFDGAYLDASGPGAQTFTGGGFRTSLVWTPAPVQETPR